jgi:hypothetical protein
MRRVLKIIVLTAAVILGGSTLATAGSPHFVGTPTASVDDSTLTVSGKIAGLGNEEQVDVQVTATVECVNRGGHNPSAGNKDDVAAVGTFPVQNGKALFELSATAEFQPECSPPMTVEFSDIVVTDVTHGISVAL